MKVVMTEPIETSEPGGETSDDSVSGVVDGIMERAAQK